MSRMVGNFVAFAAASVAGFLSASAVSSRAAADPVSDFYAGKTITIWVGYGTGGGYDTMARLVARHYGDHVPGQTDGDRAERSRRGQPARSE